jgi:uncharacterized short protein YbdD (DUF466 family)
MKNVIQRIGGTLTRAWQGFRALTGEDAYERFLDHHREAHPGVPPPDRRRFYLERQNHKWSGINRCC